MAGRSFNATERFVSDVSSRKLKAAYVLVGDELFVSDYANHRVQSFNPQTGQFIRKFGSQGSGNFRGRACHDGRTV